MNQQNVSISLERAKKYAKHQHYRGTLKEPLIEFEDWEVANSDNSDDFILKLDYNGVQLLKQALSKTMARGEVLDFSEKLEKDLYKYITDFEKR